MLPKTSKEFAVLLAVPVVLCIPPLLITAFTPDVGGENWQITHGWRCAGGFACVVFAFALVFAFVFFRIAKLAKASPVLLKIIKRAFPLLICWIACLPIVGGCAFWIADVSRHLPMSNPSAATNNLPLAFVNVSYRTGVFCKTFLCNSTTNSLGIRHWSREDRSGRFCRDGG